MSSNQNLRLKRVLLLSSVAIGLASPALAQTTAAAKPADTAITVGEVIVTTQRRSERLRDVPISVAAATGAQLEQAGVSNIKELSFFVPGVKIDQTSNYVQPAIRGISSSVTGPSTDAPVAVYVDGVIQPNQAANHFDFADIDRMEVAKGPQGTLFGRNATGGAVSVFTKSPSFKPAGSVTVGYGNFSNVLAKGYVTGPIFGDVLAGSLSLYYNKHDGYSYDIARKIDTEGLDSKLVRGKLLYKPTSWAAFTLTASYQDRRDSDTADGIALGRNTVENVVPHPANTVINDPSGIDTTAIIATQPHTISFDTNSFLDLHQASGILRSEFFFDFGTLTMINSASKVWANVSYDADRASSTLSRTAYIYPQPDDTYTNELTFASRKFNRFSFVAGLYDYYDNNRFAPNNVYSSTAAAPGFSFNSWNPARAHAAFGEVNVELTDRLLLIAGLRYSTESRSNKGSATFGMPAPLGPFQQGPRVTFSRSTPRLSLRYKVNDTTNVYATYSEGFKSGGIQSTAFLVPPAFWAATHQIYQPETIKAYEVGIKTSLGPQLSFNLAAYHYNYNNLQVQVQTAPGAGTIQNAATAIIDGLDGDIRWKPVDGLTLTGGVSLLNARYDQFKNALVLVPITTAAGTACLPGTTATAIPQGNAACGIDASGNTLPRAPKATLTLGVDYKKDIGAGDIDVSAEAFYTTRVYFDSNERINQPAYALFNAQASFQPHGSAVKISVWGKNLTDKDYISSTFIQNTADVVGYGTPRTYGVELNYSF
jgi:iron complex outermembrane receptor protein